MTGPRRLDVARIVEACDRRGVEYLLVGGVAATAHGAERVTEDADTVVRRTAENLDATALVLKDLNAHVLVEGLSDEEARARTPTDLAVSAAHQAQSPGAGDPARGPEGPFHRVLVAATVEPDPRLAVQLVALVPVDVGANRSARFGRGRALLATLEPLLGMPATGPDFISLQVRDLDASQALYEQYLGLVRSQAGPPHALVFETKPIVFALRDGVPGTDLASVLSPASVPRSGSTPQTSRPFTMLSSPASAACSTPAALDPDYALFCDEPGILRFWRLCA